MPYKILKERDFFTLKTHSEQLSNNIQQAKLIISDLEKGDFEKEYSFENNRNNELLASLIGMRDRLKEVQKVEQERKWITEGLAKFADLLRENEASLSDFSAKIVSQLVKYLDATLGAIFLVEKNTSDLEFLKLSGCYAYTRKKYLDIEILKGEGLVGQCWLEKEMIFLTEIPNNYMQITSGLGGANPSCVIIYPLIANDEAYGILEIASFKVFTRSQTEFISKICESLAGVIKNIKINEHTRKLLSSSEQLTEKLLQQEEEMRQNMEELQATQEELLRKEQLNISTIQQLRSEYDATLDEIKQREQHLQKIKNELLEKLTSNNALIDVAGRQRMLSQKIGFYAEMILRGNTSGMIMLEKAIQMHEESLLSIKNGGFAPGYDSEILPKADEALLPTINKVEEIWTVYKEASSQILALAKNGNDYINNLSKIKDSVKIIEENGELLLKLNNELLQECSKINKSKILELYK